MKSRVFVIVREEKKILLIRESNPKYKKKWFLPGGVLKENETIVQTALRHAHEEAGYEIAVNGVCFIRYLSLPVTEKGLYIYCTGRILEGSCKKVADEYSMESEWFDLATIEKLELRGDCLDVIYRTRANVPLISTDQLEL
jgi:ADP-ribose pyrophosphatase YjhB (NUDIX family)